MKRPPAPAESILEAVGSTPLIRLQRIARGIRTPVYGKAENLNPGGSVKDRIGLAIIEGAERRGELKPGGVVVEATSGNTGIGLAIAAAIKGYRCIFTIPDKMSSEKISLLRAYGAEVIVVPTAVPPGSPRVLHQEGAQHRGGHPGGHLRQPALQPRQPRRPTTAPRARRSGSRPKGKITHFVCSPGTGGTITGVGRYLKEKNPDVQVVAGDPVGSIYAEYGRPGKKGQGGPYKVEGIGGDKIPTSLDFDVVDEWMTVTDADAFRTARRLTREEGIFIGGSGGLNVWCALEVARRLDDPEALVVTILCDTGERYLSKLYDDAWMRENQMLDAERMTAGQLLRRHPEGVPPHRLGRPGGEPAPGPQPAQHLGRLAAAGGGRRRLRRLGAERASWPGSSRTSALLDRPVSEVMAGPFPVVDADVPIDRLVTHALEGDAGGPHPGRRPPRRHRQPLRRAARGGRDRLSRGQLDRTRATAACQPA